MREERLSNLLSNTTGPVTGYANSLQNIITGIQICNDNFTALARKNYSGLGAYAVSCASDYSGLTYKDK